MIKGSNEFQERHNKLSALVDSTDAMSVGNNVPQPFDYELAKKVREEEEKKMQHIAENTFYDDTEDGEGMIVYLDTDSLVIHNSYLEAYGTWESKLNIKDLMNFLKEKGAI